MLQSQVFPYYRECVENLTKAYAYMQSFFDEVQIEELCTMRGYVDEEHRTLFKEMNIGYCNIDDITELGSKAFELGLITKQDGFLLNNRFIIPVEDIAGNLSTFIGYYPDYKKYITVSTPFFSKGTMFFNYRQALECSFEKWNGLVILVEGIFDCLSLRSIGLPCIATMGSDVTQEKCELLRVFRKVLAIPDDDKTGRRALDRYSKYGWKVPSTATMIKFVGGYVEFNGTELHCKDMDNFVAWYEKEDVIESLLQFKDSREEIEVLKL